MPLGKKSDAFAHQLGKQRPLVVREDRVADLRQDHGVAVGRGPLEHEEQDGYARQDGDAADILLDIGLVDALAEDIGQAGGRPRRTPHQQECQQVAPPVGGSLLHDQAANQDRGAIGVVSDLLWKFGHPRSIDSADIYSRVRAKAKRLLACYIGVFQAKSGLARNEILGRGCLLVALALAGQSPLHVSPCVAMASISYCGVHSRFSSAASPMNSATPSGRYAEKPVDRLSM